MYLNLHFTFVNLRRTAFEIYLSPFFSMFQDLRTWNMNGLLVIMVQSPQREKQQHQQQKKKKSCSFFIAELNLPEGRRHMKQPYLSLFLSLFQGLRVSLCGIILKFCLIKLVNYLHFYAQYYYIERKQYSIRKGFLISFLYLP